jgi:hypothetical protein
MMANPEEVLLIDSIRIDVESKVDTTYNFNPDGDIIVISAIFHSDDSELDFVQVKNIDYFLSRVIPKESTESLEDYHSRLMDNEIFKTVASMWAVGGRNILIIKAADTDDIPNNTFQNKWEFIYSKTKIALEYAAELEFVGLIYSVDAKYEAVIDTDKTEETLTPVNGTYLEMVSTGNYFVGGNDITITKTDDETTTTVSSSKYTINKILRRVVLTDGIEQGMVYTISYRKVYSFLDLMASICANSVSNGIIIQSVLSAQQNDVTNILNDETLSLKFAWQEMYCKTQYKGISNWVPNNDKFRFVSVVTGSATIGIEYNGLVFEYGLGPAIVGLMSILEDDIAVSGRIINGVRLFDVPTQSEADLLSFYGFIPIGDTVKARRGIKDEVRALADQNMGVVRSELRQTAILRLVRRLGFRVRDELQQYIGMSERGISDSIKSVLETYIKSNIIRRYNYKISRPSSDLGKVLILIQVLPYFSAKVIEVSITAGSNRA